LARICWVIRRVPSLRAIFPRSFGVGFLFASWVWFQNFSFPSFLGLKRMERCFFVEAKRFSYSAKSEVLDLCLEERRKWFCGFIFLGFQASFWLLTTIEEALKVSAKDFVKYFWEDVKVLMV
jgi:hypothetical protein